MILLENKLDIFEKIVYLNKEKECLEELTQEKNKLEEDINKKEKDLKKMREEVLTRRVNLANKQKNEILTEVNEKGRILKLKKDEELLEKLILKLEDKVISFVETEDYIEFEKNNFAEILENLDEGKYIVKTLQKNKNKLFKMFSDMAKNKNIELEYEVLQEEYLAGFIITDMEKTYSIDASFKSKIETNRYNIGKLLHYTLQRAGEEN